MTRLGLVVVVVVVDILAFLAPNTNQSHAFVPARNTPVPKRTRKTTTKTQHTSFIVPHALQHPLFGILDDMSVAEPTEDVLSESTVLLANHPVEFQDLYHDLIFATDLSRLISKRLAECTNPTFLEFLRSLQQQCTKEEEAEYQGLEELMETIRAAQTQCQNAAEDEAQKVKMSTTTRVGKDDNETSLEQSSHMDATDSRFLSNADVIKRANQIDKAVAAAALSDDEKPSDFISDCRDVVNLSRSFNNQGQMRVGGR